MLLIPLLSMHLHFTPYLIGHIFSWIYVFNVAHQANSKQLGVLQYKYNFNLSNLCLNSKVVYLQ